MPNDRKAVTLNVENGWLECPFCHRSKRVKHILPTSCGSDIVAYCPKCKRELLLNIERGLRVELLNP